MRRETHVERDGLVITVERRGISSGIAIRHLSRPHGRFIVLPSKLLAVQGQEVWPVSVDDLRRRGRRQGGPTLGRGPQGPVLRPQGAPGLSGMLVSPPMAGGPVSAMEQRAGPRGQPS